MTVYVDDYNASYRGMKMCHMLADTLDELHDMANRIGLKRSWYQGPPKTRTMHYDICLTKKKLAIQYGAIEVTVRQLAVMNRIRRETGSLGTPEQAQKDLDKRWKQHG